VGGKKAGRNGEVDKGKNQKPGDRRKRQGAWMRKYLSGKTEKELSSEEAEGVEKYCSVVRLVKEALGLQQGRWKKKERRIKGQLGDVFINEVSLDRDTRGKSARSKRRPGERGKSANHPQERG